MTGRAGAPDQASAAMSRARISAPVDNPWIPERPTPSEGGGNAVQAAPSWNGPRLHRGASWGCACAAGGQRRTRGGHVGKARQRPSAGPDGSKHLSGPADAFSILGGVKSSGKQRGCGTFFPFWPILRAGRCHCVTARGWHPKHRSKVFIPPPWLNRDWLAKNVILVLTRSPGFPIAGSGHLKTSAWVCQTSSTLQAT